MKISKIADKLIIAFILIGTALMLYRVIFLGQPFRQRYYEKVYNMKSTTDGFTGCPKGFCS